jgi:NADH dehydrogenase
VKKILIIGAGFAGLSAARRLCKSGLPLDISIIDKKQTFDFLPLLPDCLGRGIDPEFLSRKIDIMGRKFSFKFIRQEVVAIDLEKKEVATSLEKLNYDYLIIASGSDTNFYGNDNIRKSAYKVDGVEDIMQLLRVLEEQEYSAYIIGGGGYTGIEVATNLRLFLKKRKKSGRIIIIERASSILGPLPVWMKDYVAQNLKDLNIEVLVNSAIERIEGKRVLVAAGPSLEQALVIWAAGVKTSAFLQGLNLEKNPQGRLKVDGYLKINDSCYLAGDAAYFSHNNNYLRMAVQFAITEGECAAINIANSIRGLNLREYHPVDLGYVIPMANNKSCGTILGMNLKGALPTMLHFLMCIYRSCGWRNKLGIIGSLLTGGGR